MSDSARSAVHAPRRTAKAHWLMGLCCAACVVLGGFAKTAGPMPWAATAVLVALFTGLGFARSRHAPAHTTEAEHGDVTAPDLVRQVVPVWERSVEAARLHSEKTAQDLLERFANISTMLEQSLGQGASSPQLEMGAADSLLEQRRPELERLLSTTRAVVRLKDEVLTTLNGMNTSLQEMVSLSQQVQVIGRATHMLALNASVEATRAGASGTGFAVVAQEVRQLATQSRTAAVQIARLVSTMQQQMGQLGNRAEQSNTDDDELVMQAEENARAVITGLLEGINEASRSSRHLLDTSQLVHADLERVLVNLQSQDRLSQMICCVRDDMARMTRNLTGEENDPAAVDARLWLERLEASYTMEEQRNSHHATVNIDRQPAVEFF